MVPLADKEIFDEDDFSGESRVYINRDVLSAHYIPETLLHRDKEIEKIKRVLIPALRNQRPNNLFIYGKTGVGKTCCVKYLMEKIDAQKKNVKMIYTNCRIYNSQYKIIQKIAETISPELSKQGLQISHMYEEILKWINENETILIAVLDEVDMIKDLNELMYTLIRANDELKKGAVSVVGITNNAMFQRKLDPRSKSSLCETEIVFHTYDALQLAEILDQRAKIGIKTNMITDSAIKLNAAIAAAESGDARYALKLLLKACDIVDERGIGIIDEHEIEIARKSVDEDIAIEIINTLPQQQQMVLYAAAMLNIGGGKYAKLDGKIDDGALMSGELYEKYCNACEKYHFKPRSARWYRQYLSDLEMLGLITMVESGAGVRGHTRFIKMTYPAHIIKEIIEKIYGA